MHPRILSSFHEPTHWSAGGSPARFAASSEATGEPPALQWRRITGQMRANFGVGALHEPVGQTSCLWVRAASCRSKLGAGRSADQQAGSLPHIAEDHGRNAVARFGCLLALAIPLGMIGFGSTAAADFASGNAFSVPLGLDSPLPVPADNPLTPEKVALGGRLFFDPALSRSRSVSCSSCHLAGHGFGGNSSLPVGIDGRIGRRNAPTLLNRAYGESLFWDGRAATLEIQALQPIQNPAEMGIRLEELLQRLGGDAEYRRAFKAAFQDGISTQNVARALASFQRTLLTGNSAVDRFRHGDVTALSDSSRHGLWLFESRGLCWKCHSGRNFTDEKLHNTGVGWGRTPGDFGRFEVTGKEEDRARFKTPTLRDVAKTAPYMHDGSLAALREVVEFYSRGGTPNPNLDPIMKPLQLSETEIQSLVDFLEALTGEVAPEPQPKHEERAL